ncbi:hypothetical protein KCP76_05885 [Salmonella enterica subsp. enterica serovar Weltevreden]|nr:hypothetical protein KCP76_05885 [Salmonella enterica subsp. enterica serovar Weltevreden]
MIPPGAAIDPITLVGACGQGEPLTGKLHADAGGDRRAYAAWKAMTRNCWRRRMRAKWLRLYV